MFKLLKKIICFSENTCDLIVPNNNSELECSAENYLGSVCTISCNYGYKLSMGNDRIDCKSSGWSGKLSSCERKNIFTYAFDNVTKYLST